MACSRGRRRSCARSPSARCGTSRTPARESSATSSTRDSISRRSRCAPPSGPTGRPRRSSPMPPGRRRARTQKACSSLSTCSRGGRPSMLDDLGRGDVRIKWLVTGLLATLGLSYVFGAVMVALYAGFTPQSVAATYAGSEMSMPMPPETTMVVQRPMSMADFAKPEVHTVDTKLLIQDTHVHVPMYGLIAAALGVVVAGLSLSRRWALGLIGLLFAAPWLDFAGMWLTKFSSPRFAIVTLARGWAIGVAYLIVAAPPVHPMWLSHVRVCPLTIL